MAISTAHLETLTIRPGLVGFYDGRVRGYRAYSEAPNWIDDGAIKLGICTFALIDGRDALVYDTHVSPAHGRIIRDTVERLGARDIRVVLSHWHLDHVVGNEVFQDCEIIAHRHALEALQQHRAAIEAGTLWGEPAIRPLVMPTTTFDDEMTLEVGKLRVRLRHLDIHSRDGAVLHLPEDGTLIAGDTLEDAITYVAEPEGFETHRENLIRMQGWGLRHILPCHGRKEVIAAGGYGPELITANLRYLERLLARLGDPKLLEEPLTQFIAPELAEGWIAYLPEYEPVHRQNIERGRAGRV